MERIEPRTFTIEQAAAYLQVEHKQVRKLVWARAVKYVRLGKRILIDRKSLDTWFEKASLNPK